MKIDEKSDRKAVLAAVKEDGNFLENASEDLKADREIVLAALKHEDMFNGAYNYVSNDLKADREIVLAAMKISASYLENSSEILKADREFILAALKQDGYGFIIKYVSEDLKADREIVLAAVKRNGGELEYATDALKADREIVLAAVKQNKTAFEYAAKALKNDLEIVAVSKGLTMASSKEDIMAKVYELDQDEYPDGVDQNINLDPEVWDRGYCLETDEGIWYEVYVNDDNKKGWPDLDKDEFVTKFHGINLSQYKEYNQITFIEPNGEEKYTLDELHEYLV